MPAVLTRLPTDQSRSSPSTWWASTPCATCWKRFSAHSARRCARGPADRAQPGRLVDDIAADGHGLVMLMGKGGVGKTTLAAAVAVELARRGLPVHLTTSDPAAHLAETLARHAGAT
jgi:arsenite-transporting ATPase